MRLITVLLFAFLLTGCGDESKMKTACLDIAKDASVDPGSLSVNSVDFVRSKIQLGDFYPLISKKYHGHTPTEITDVTDSLVHKEQPPVAVTVSINYTANGITGKVRDNAECTFLTEALPKPFLISVVVGRKRFDVDKLEVLFSSIKRPAGLSEVYFLE